MKWRKWLEHWDMTELNIKTGFLDMKWNPKDADKNAAWELYVELLTPGDHTIVVSRARR